MLIVDQGIIVLCDCGYRTVLHTNERQNYHNQCCINRKCNKPIKIKRENIPGGQALYAFEVNEKGE